MLPAVDAGADSTRQAERGCGPKRDYVTAARSAPSRGGPSATGTYFRAVGSRSSLVFWRSRAAFFADCRACALQLIAPGWRRASPSRRLRSQRSVAGVRLPRSRQLLGGARGGVGTPWRAFHVEHRRLTCRRLLANPRGPRSTLSSLDTPFQRGAAEASRPCAGVMLWSLGLFHVEHAGEGSGMHTRIRQRGLPSETPGAVHVEQREACDPSPGRLGNRRIVCSTWNCRRLPVIRHCNCETSRAVPRGTDDHPRLHREPWCRKT
jgi:hypothetical protein